MIEWIEKLKVTKGKASVCLREETVLEIENICRQNGFDSANLSQFITSVCQNYDTNFKGEELEKVKSDLLIAVEANKELANQVNILREGLNTTLKNRTNIGQQLSEAKEELNKLGKERDAALDLLMKAQGKITADTNALESFKNWLAKERNRISSWWSSPPPIQ